MPELEVEVSDELAAFMAEEADRRGVTVEQLFHDWLHEWYAAATAPGEC